MAKKRQREIEEAVADGDWKRVYELEHGIEFKETSNLLKGVFIGFGLAIAGVTIGGLAMFFIKK